MMDAELNWFDLETRMRKLVFELLEPTINRSQEDKEQISLAKKSLIQHNKRLEELEICLFKSNEKKTIFEEIYKKIAENEVERKHELS